MKSKKLIFKILLSVILNISFFKIASSEIKFPLIIQKTDPLANKGMEYEQGIIDYFKMINERDGGIRGKKIVFPKCEKYENINNGLNCYEKHKVNAVVFNLNSQSLANKLILKAISDRVSIFTSGYGQSFYKNGNIFKWMFNSPSNYVEGASIAISYIRKNNLGNINGKKIALVYLKNPLDTDLVEILNILSQKHKYRLIPLPLKKLKNQGLIWSKVKKVNPDYILLHGLGLINSEFVNLSKEINFPFENIIGIHWSESEKDLIKYGSDIDSYKALTFTNNGRKYEVHNNILNYVYFKNDVSDKMSYFGTIEYNRGLFNGMINVEAAKMNLKDELIMEYRMVQKCQSSGDFYEGVRAMLVDKDKNPIWQPTTLEQADNIWINHFFESLGEQDLKI